LFTGQMTWRELKIFLDNLPRDSATYRSLYGDGADWTPEVAILADIWDLYAGTHAGRRKPPTYPRPKFPDDN
jgi:hypothetical protein